MTASSISAITIEGISPSVENELRQAIDNFQQGGVPCGFHYKQPLPQACLDWLAATAAVIWLADKYFGTMIEKAAEDHYQLIKRGFQNIYDNTLGPNPSITRVITQVNGTVRHDKVFSGNLSFVYRSSEGCRVKLLFPINTSPVQYERSCSEFSVLIREFLKQPEASALNAEIEAQAKEKLELLPPNIKASHMRSSVSLLIYWDDTSQSFHVAEPSASSRTGRLVSWPLGQRV